MIEILVVIAVVRAFVRKAEEKKLNKTLWGFIGAASYYIPVLLTGLIVLPLLVVNGIISVGSETQFLIMSVFINILIGVLCCFVAYQILKNKEVQTKPINTEILDDELD